LERCKRKYSDCCRFGASLDDCDCYFFSAGTLPYLYQGSVGDFAVKNLSHRAVLDGPDGNGYDQYSVASQSSWPVW